MVKKEISSGDDGALDHHGEALPQLSKSASVVDIDRIEKKRRIAAVQGKHPGIIWFYQFIRNLCRVAIRQQFRTIEITGQENISDDAGILTVGWHTNGLIDPAIIFVTQPKMLVFGGRHDLITRPVIGPIASMAGTQPVIRQAERARGGASAEAATRINSKTMLTLAECIAHGHGTALFPEGTSHEESKMKRLRTGPMRSVIAANSIAREKGLPAPHLLPVGLHFRISWHFRTDAWVEYGKPIPLSDSLHPENDRARLLNGEWVEAPAEVVNNLRDEVHNHLTPMTPDADSWNQHRAWHLLGNATSLVAGKKLQTWREEVLAAREVRTKIRNGDKLLQEIEPKAEEIAKKLHNNGLDSRVLGENGLNKPSLMNRIAIFPAIFLALIAAPLTLAGSGLMILVGKVMGDRTDEGLDARTTYHYLASMLGPLIVWPIPITIFILIAIFGAWDITATQIVIATVSLPFLFHLSNKIAIMAWDMYVISRDANRLKNISRSEEGQYIAEEFRKILAVLK